jgi:metacaspase-1
MTKGIALTIGLNAVDPVHYGGWSGDLVACENDANDMADIAKTQGFVVTKLLTKAATRVKVIARIKKAAQLLKAGEMFLLSYSGHGGQLPDKNSDEDDAVDETWCLYDGELVDDELYMLFGRFKPGVRIAMFSDSCHSGTVAKAAYYKAMPPASAKPGAMRYRFMPAEVAQRTYSANRAFYDPILKDKALKESRDQVKASVLLISGCQDNQYSADGDFNGLFTAHLLNVWNDGKFKGSYRKFQRAIVKQMPPDQTPNYYRVGGADPKFDALRPFTLV